MLTFKIIRLLHLVVYFFIAAQLVYYFYLMGDALKQVSIGTFLEERRVVHPLVVKKHQMVYYFGLFLSLLMVVLAQRQQSPLTLVTCSIAFVCIVAEVIISLKGNAPLNTLVQQYSLVDTTTDWEAVRRKWIELIKIRGLLITIGILSLFAGLVFKK